MYSFSKTFVAFFFIFGGVQLFPEKYFSNQTFNNWQLQQTRQSRQESLTIGSCIVVLNRHCPDPDVRFFLYTKDHKEDPEEVFIGSEHMSSNLSRTSFDPKLPTKIIVHGYNSGMFLNALVELRRQYMVDGNLNVFAVDWGNLAQGPCYPAAVWNSRFAGKCSSLLVERIRELGNTDIHVIGFSLGAHVTNFMANNLLPYKLPRITGLDPAMPGFATVNNENKLDASDAEFVDVLHTNAFLQGKVEQCGHVDFYMNGGIIQPGCWSEDRFFACNHHRAPYYFAESVHTQLGFWGWPCSSYFQYLLGRCPPKEPQILMGEKIDRKSRGMYLVITESIRPFAVGKFTGPTIEILRHKNEQNRLRDFEKYKKDISNCVDEDDFDETRGEVQRRPGEFTEEDFDDIFDVFHYPHPSVLVV